MRASLLGTITLAVAAVVTSICTVQLVQQNSRLRGALRARQQATPARAIESGILRDNDFDAVAPSLPACKAAPQRAVLLVVAEDCEFCDEAVGAWAGALERIRRATPIEF